MDLNNNDLSIKLNAIKESLIDYVGPILIFGDISWLLENKDINVVSAISPKEKFMILDNNIPNWINNVEKRKDNISNILIINDLDKISIDEQELLLDILEINKVSNRKLPNNLKIILNANKKCELISNIRDIVECYEI